MVLIDQEEAHESLALAESVAAHEELDDVVMVLLTDGSLDEDRVLETGVSASLVRPVSVPEVRATLLEQVAGVSPPARARTNSAPARRVLVVEDNEANQLVAITLLSSMGFAHDVAADGVQALQLLDHTTYDAVLMDVQMPVLDGYDTTRALREREECAGSARMPVVAITASAVQGERDRCLAAGMDDFLTKPVDLGALTRTLHRWVGLGEAPATTGEVELARTPPSTEPSNGSPIGPGGPARASRPPWTPAGSTCSATSTWRARPTWRGRSPTSPATPSSRSSGSGCCWPPTSPRPRRPWPTRSPAAPSTSAACGPGSWPGPSSWPARCCPRVVRTGSDAGVAELDQAMAQARELLADYQRVHVPG